ncbi:MULTISPECIES: YneF family protein [unclassified Granulicatella]|uniref:YneF family protein n=1 Tax=unclassified Granulicatella TaxID=2630493 RepID=UPI00107372D8|nr:MULTISPECIES: YneF family protein [unclassified Granulicatella]MBF0780026.1 YneF family protein [Granulicatella sp. 19428wC4_WM01]TFU95876.1 YneF family protein [Granulicatella sp. WM01]
MEPVWVVIIALLTFVAGGFLGFFLARKYIMKYFEENPPIDDTMIRTMMAQMGQKPSEKKVQQIVQSMKMQHNKKKK